MVRANNGTPKFSAQKNSFAYWKKIKIKVIQFFSSYVDYVLNAPTKKGNKSEWAPIFFFLLHVCTRVAQSAF